MTIQELVDKCKVIALDKLGFKSFHVGNEWDHSLDKKNTYPALWFEMPVLVEYNIVGKQTKIFTFSLVFLTMPKLDNVEDELNMISHMEVYCDAFLQYLRQDKELSQYQIPTSLSVKAINADVACGVRLDLKIVTGRACDIDGDPICLS